MNKLNVRWWMKCLHSFKVAPLKILINYEGGKSNFPVEKPGSPTLIRDPSEDDQQRDISKWWRWREHTTQHHTCDIPDKHQVTSNKPILKGPLRNKWLAIFTNIKVIKVKEDLRNYFRLRETEKTWQLNATWFWIGYFSFENIMETIGKAED